MNREREPLTITRLSRRHYPGIELETNAEEAPAFEPRPASGAFEDGSGTVSSLYWLHALVLVRGSET